MRRYRVVWKDGKPSIQGCTVALVGKNKQKKSTFKNANIDAYAKESNTIEGALENAVRELVSTFAPDGVFSVVKFKPWSLCRTLARISRLRAKLRKHNLV